MHSWCAENDQLTVCWVQHNVFMKTNYIPKNYTNILNTLLISNMIVTPKKLAKTVQRSTYVKIIPDPSTSLVSTVFSTA